MIFRLLLFMAFLPSALMAQVIDAHLHAYTDQDYWGGRTHQTGVNSPELAKEHMDQTIGLMDKHDIRHAVVCGSIEATGKYVAADPRFIPGYTPGDTIISPSEFERHIKEGKIKVFGEIMAVYQGRTLNDPIYEPYLKLCETYGIPVGYHSGGGPSRSPYTCCPEFRIALGDPLLIEDVLVKFPKLKIYLMHGGEVFYEHAIRMMMMYPQLYIDLGVLLWVNPALEDYAVNIIKKAQRANVLDRVIYGTDQMVWPGAISKSLSFLDSLEFLSAEEKKMLLYTNAKEFFKL